MKTPHLDIEEYTYAERAKPNESTRLYSLREVAEQLGMHNEQVRRIEKRALKKLKAYFDNQNITFEELS